MPSVTDGNPNGCFPAPDLPYSLYSICTGPNSDTTNNRKNTVVEKKVFYRPRKSVCHDYRSRAIIIRTSTDKYHQLKEIYTAVFPLTNVTVLYYRRVYCTVPPKCSHCRTVVAFLKIFLWQIVPPFTLSTNLLSSHFMLHVHSCNCFLRYCRCSFDFNCT